jgi:hypothetical protein
MATVVMMMMVMMVVMVVMVIVMVMVMMVVVVVVMVGLVRVGVAMAILGIYTTTPNNMFSPISALAIWRFLPLPIVPATTPPPPTNCGSPCLLPTLPRLRPRSQVRTV